jgi:hypothetical protein
MGGGRSMGGRSIEGGRGSHGYTHPSSTRSTVYEGHDRGQRSADAGRSHSMGGSYNTGRSHSMSGGSRSSGFSGGTRSGGFSGGSRGGGFSGSSRGGGGSHHQGSHGSRGGR